MDAGKSGKEKMMEIQLGNILEAACAMAGYELVTGTVPLRWRVMAGTAVNEGLRRIHAEKFQALRRVEFRRYRPIEEDLDEAAARYAVGQECWSKAQGSSVSGSSVSGDTIAGTDLELSRNTCRGGIVPPAAHGCDWRQNGASMRLKIRNQFAEKW
jgi:hypothetical protein